MLKNNFENGVITMVVLALVIKYTNEIWHVLSITFESSMKGQEVFILLPVFLLFVAWLGLHVFRFLVSFILYFFRKK